MAKDEPLALDYFVAGVPTGESFRMVLEDIREISIEKSDLRTGINRLQEICFVGVMGYFEAFCKDHFASLINIEPSLIDLLKKGGQNVTIDGATVALYGSEISHKLGFLISEKYDFGTAQKINALYSALLKITPFSKDEIVTYSNMLRDRNLVVHHGGVYTMSYLSAHPEFQISDSKLDAFWNSCVIAKDYVISVVDFLSVIAKKMINATHSAIVQYVDEAGVSYSDERKKALHFIVMWGDSDEA